MLLKLNSRAILNNTHSEEDLPESSVLEFIYAIRKFKAVIDSDSNYIEVIEGSDNQVYSEKYKIWFQHDEYTK